MKDLSVYTFGDYKAYLSQVLAPTGESRGLRSKLASKLGCQTGFISQVMNGAAHFSLEHALTIADFLGHSPDERRYFLLLVHKGRAGTKALENYYQEQLNELAEKRRVIAERISVRKELSLADQVVHYSS